MPKLRLAMLFDSRESDYVGHTRYFDFKQADSSHNQAYFEAEIEIDEAIAKAVELTRHLWEPNSKIPLAFVDNTGHGENRGLVIKSGLCKTIQSTGLDVEEIVESELVTRISFGGNRKERKQDFTKPYRTHFSVLATRCFFPIDWKELGIKETEHLVETANYSLRWVNEEFDDWSNPQEWNPHDRTLDHKEFNSRRTTYAASYIQKVNRRNTVGGEESPDALKLVEIAGRKPRILPLSPNIAQFDRKLDYANKLLRNALNGGVRGVVPIVGSSEVYLHLRNATNFEYLSEDAKRLALNGANFVFGPVLKSMTLLANSDFSIK